MGQHLNLYAIDSADLAAAKAWCDCRAKELNEMPSPGFEEEAHKRIQQLMWDYMRTDSIHYLHCGSTWAASVWHRLVWSPVIASDEVVERARHDLEYFMLWNQNLPGIGSDWASHPIFDFLRQHEGWCVWGDNDGI